MAALLHSPYTGKFVNRKCLPDRHVLGVSEVQSVLTLNTASLTNKMNVSRLYIYDSRKGHHHVIRIGYSKSCAQTGTARLLETRCEGSKASSVTEIHRL